MRSIIPQAVCLVLFAAPSALADEQTYFVAMTGAQEAPGPGDPDGKAFGTLTLNDTTGLVSWDFSYSNIAAPSAMHIHGPNGSFGNPAGVFIGLGVGTTGGPGTLTNSLVHPTLSNITDILGDPGDYYVNIHNSEFGSGAVRGQVPEPSTLMALGVCTLVALRRRQN